MGLALKEMRRSLVRYSLLVAAIGLLVFLILFQQAAKAETLTAEFLARLRRYLLLAKNDPNYRFEPAAAAPAG